LEGKLAWFKVAQCEEHWPALTKISGFRAHQTRVTRVIGATPQQ